jgi:hypothetical protein
MLLYEIKHHKLQKPAVLDQLRQIRDNAKNPENVFCSFTNIDKLGIYPKSNWLTPLGIYAYPIKYVIGMGGKVPFGATAPFIQVFELDPSATIWKLDNNNVCPYGPKVQKTIEEMYNMDAEITSTSDCREVWYAIFSVAETLSSSRQRQTTISAKILRRAGIDVVWDPGYEIICPAEPTQVLFLQPGQLTRLKSLDNTMYYQSTHPQDLEQLSAAPFQTVLNAAMRLPHRNKKIEQILLQKLQQLPPRTILDLLLYINKYVKHRWTEVEPLILQDPLAIVGYTEDVIKGRWREGEWAMLDSRNALSMFQYANQVIKGRWIEAEPFIAGFGDRMWREYKTIHKLPLDYQPPSINY